MEKRAKQLEYLITSMILLGIGMLFFFMNESVNTYTVLRFGLFQIMQSVLLLICAILLWYRAYVVRREQETAEGGAETLGAAQAARRRPERKSGRPSGTRWTASMPPCCW